MDGCYEYERNFEETFNILLKMYIENDINPIVLNFNGWQATLDVKNDHVRCQ